MKIKSYIFILASAALISSCKKDFLDLLPPTAVGIGEAIKTESDMGDAVNGMYATMRSNLSYGRNIPVFAEVMSDNAYISSSNSGRYLGQNNLTFTVANAETSEIWSQNYYTILQANRILNAPLTATPIVNQLRGEAYTARAIAYLTLVNFFAKPFTVDPNGDGVPIITAYTGPNIQPVRNKTAEVYTRIQTDLDSAFFLMPATAPAGMTHAFNSEYVSKYAAKAIQARAYLFKGDYANARDAALAVVNNGGYTLVSATGFAGYWANAAASTNKVETIFELALNTATNNGTNGLDYIYNPAGYGDILATNDLYNLHTATDVRRTLILNGTRSGNQAYIVNKYQNVTSANDKDDLKIIRYGEVIITLAEAYARLGDNVNALLYLNQLAKQRDPSFTTGYVSTGAQLITDILNERRKELAFEGLRFFDFTRLNLPIVRPTQANSAPSIGTIAIDNTRRVLPIPQSETDANPNIKQNPGY